MSKNPQIAFGFSVLVLITTLSGCGAGDGLDRRYPVSGRVTYKGEPLKKGKINFLPDDTSIRPGAGDVQDGEIVNVTTMSPGDGLFAGKYKVIISALEDVDLSGVTKKYPGVVPQTVAAKVEAKAKSLIPLKYSVASDSGLTADVSSSNRTFTYELKD